MLERNRKGIGECKTEELTGSIGKVIIFQIFA